MHELSEKIYTGNGKIKSQRGGPVDFFVNYRIKWPHEYVLSGQNKDRVMYNQLTLLQWMRVQHANQRASHAVLLCRLTAFVGHISQQTTQGKTHEKNGKQPTKFVTCVYFNKNICSQTKKIMKRKVSIIGIFVRRVGKWMVRRIHIHR